MKLASVTKLVSAVEAKTGLAKVRLAETRNRQRALIDEAARCDLDARALFEPLAEDAAEMLAAARRQSALERAASALRAEAEALQPEIETRRDALKTALREEIAWRRLERRLHADAQKRRSSQEEERREAIVLQSRR
jgi:hypothetical protein